MRYSVRDHKAVVHSVNFVAEINSACWVPVMEAKTVARNTRREFTAYAMCEARVKIHSRTARRLGSDTHTCLLCLMEEHRVEAA